jgi:hypothetical protein
MKNSPLAGLLNLLTPLIACGWLLGSQALASTWTPLAQQPATGVERLELLPDGTVMAQEVVNGLGTKNWYRLTPDATGSYVNGTWAATAPMHDTRLFYASAVLPGGTSSVLPNGRLLVAGGEYGSGGARSEIYDPVADTWTQIPIPAALLDPTQPSQYNDTINQSFDDSGAVVLPGGDVLVEPVFSRKNGDTLIYRAATGTWSDGPSYLSFTQDEATWVKLPDDSILTVDPPNPDISAPATTATNSERYIPSQNKWVADANLPVALYSNIGAEIGPGFLLPDGRAFFIGASGATAFYTPSGDTTPGSWAAGPTLPTVSENVLNASGNTIGTTTVLGSAPDAPGAMMVNGKILCALSGGLYMSGTNTIYPAPTTFFEFDPVANAFTQVSNPSGNIENGATYLGSMLDLPDGTVLYSDYGTQLYVYQPDGAPLAAGQPSNITVHSLNGVDYLSGFLLNGISAGASYGDDVQMDTNYPIIELTDGSGNVYFANTYDWSSTGVATGDTLTSTEFSLPGTVVAGSYSLTVIANGIGSDPIQYFALAPPPSIAVTIPADGSNISVLTELAGTVNDNSNTGAGISSVMVSLSSGTNYWNGTTWQGTPAMLNATVPGDGTWSCTNLPTGSNILFGSYSVTATALDGNGNASSITTSFTLTATAPVLVITSPASGSYINTFASIDGTVSDLTGSGVPQVNFTLVSNGMYWTGSAWTPAQTVLHATVQNDGTWHYPADSTNPGDTLPSLNQQYSISASATNGGGLTSDANSGNQISVTFDNIPPTCTITAPSDGTNITANVTGSNWFTGTASDLHPSQPAITIYLQRLSDNAYWDGSQWLYQIQEAALSGTYTGANTWEIAAPAPRLGSDPSHCWTNDTYDLIAIATDFAGNNTQQDVMITVDGTVNYGAATINSPQTPAISGTSLTYNPLVFPVPAWPAPETGAESVVSAKLAPGGGYYAATSLYSNGSPDIPALDKLDVNGNVIWRRERHQTSVTTGTGADTVTTYYENWSGSDQTQIPVADTGGFIAFAGMDTDAAGNVFLAYNSLRYTEGITGVNGGGGISYGPVLTYVGETLVVRFDTNGVLTGRWWLENSAGAPDYFNGSLVQHISAVGDGSCVVMIENFDSDALDLSPPPVSPQTIVARRGSSKDYTQFYGFTTTSNGTAQSTPENLGTDASGDAYFTTLDATLDLATGLFGPQEHVIRKLDPAGNLLRTVSECSCDFPETWSAMAVDASGAIYLPGATPRDTTGQRLVLNKFDLSQPVGSELVWRSFGPSGFDSLTPALMSLSPGGITLATTANGVDDSAYWVASRFAFDGSMQWCRTYQDDNLAAYFGIVIEDMHTDSSDNVYIWGGGNVGIIAKFAATGDVQFVEPLDSTYNFTAGGPDLLLADGSIASFVTYSPSSGVYGAKLISVSNPSNVYPPVGIPSDEPADQVQPVGATVTFSVEDTGTPATYQWQKQDSNGVPKPIMNATGASLVISNAQPTDSGYYSVVATGIAAPSDVVTSRTAHLQVYAILPLSQGLENSTLVFTSTGAAPWYGQSVITNNGQSAAICSATYPQSGLLQTTVTGPGIVNFQWMCTGGFSDTYQVLLDGTAAQTCTSTTWTAGYVEVPAGQHTITWSYSPPYYGSGSGFLDQVTFGPGVPATPQLLTASSANAVVNVAAASKTVAITMHITDSPIGLAGGYAIVKSPSGTQQVTATLNGQGLTDVTVPVEFNIPRSSVAGLWTLTTVYLVDEAGNVIVYGSDLGAGQVALPAGASAQFTVQDPAPDTKAPILASVTYTPALVDVTTAAQTVSMTAHITDAGSGFGSGYVRFESTSGQSTNGVSLSYLNRISGSANNGIYQATFTVPQGSSPGLWNLYFFATDFVGNTGLYTVNGGAGAFKFPAGTPGVPPGTLKVNNGVDAIEFGASTFTASQADGKTTITVDRVNGATGTATVKYATQAITIGSNNAVPGVDYSNVAGTLTFKATDNSKTFTVPVKNTGTPGAAKTLNLVLSNVSGSSLGAPATSTLTILNSNRTLTVTVSSTNGLAEGTVTAGLKGTTTQEINQFYTIVATPAAGYLFDHWVGGADLTAAQRLDASLTFPVYDTTTLEAVFVPNKFPPVKGTYQGVLLSGAAINANTGFVSFTTTATPSFTASLTLSGLKIPFPKGSFHNDGSLTLPVVRPSDHKTLSLGLQLDLTPPPTGSGTLTGALDDGATILAQFTANKEPVYTGGATAPEKGSYTLALTTNQTPTPTHGSATILVRTNGLATIKGTLPDGTAFTQTCQVSSGSFPLYVSLYSHAGSLAGKLTFTAGSTKWSGALIWVMPTSSLTVTVSTP